MNSFYTTSFFDANLLYHVLGVAYYNGRILIGVLRLQLLYIKWVLEQHNFCDLRDFFKGPIVVGGLIPQYVTKGDIFPLQ